MRITRLHVLLFLIGLVCLIFGGLAWLSARRDEEERLIVARARAQQELQAHRVETLKDVQQQENEAMDRLAKNARASIAVIGENYLPLLKQYGEVPAIGDPLRAAKTYMEQKQYDLAMSSAQESWKALKAFRTKARSVSSSYEVVRGDTLWRIAQVHSPVRQGPGWVSIWKANKKLIPNFNRIEVGWTLNIPQKRVDYLMPFWKPRSLQ